METKALGKTPLKLESSLDFPGSLVLKTSTSGGVGLIPGQGTKTSHTVWYGQRGEK